MPCLHLFYVPSYPSGEVLFFLIHHLWLLFDRIALWPVAPLLLEADDTTQFRDSVAEIALGQAYVLMLFARCFVFNGNDINRYKFWGHFSNLTFEV